MKCIIGALTLVTLIFSLDSLATVNKSCILTAAGQDSGLSTQSWTLREQDPLVSTGVQTLLIRKDFTDRLAELRGWDSDFDQQATLLGQDIIELQGQLEQSKHEYDQIRTNQRDIRRSIYKINRELMLFEKNENLRMMIDQLQYR